MVCGRLQNNYIRRRFGIPIEFGATNLISSDRIKHGNKGPLEA